MVYTPVNIFQLEMLKVKLAIVMGRSIIMFVISAFVMAEALWHMC